MPALQDVPWLKRKILLAATVKLSIKEYIDAEGVTHIDLDHRATGGIKGTREIRMSDWMETNHKDQIFGNLKTRSRWLTDLETSESGNGGLLHPYLTGSWLDEKVGPNVEASFQKWVFSKERGWTREQIWGFSLLGRQRQKNEEDSDQEGETEGVG